MRTAWISLGILILFTAAGGLIPDASADDCPCDGPPVAVHAGHGGHGVHCTPSGNGSVRDRHHPSTRYVIPRTQRSARRYGACGSSWSSLRRHLRSYGDFQGGPYGAAGVRRAYVRSYFLRRYPFALIESEEAIRLDALLVQAERSEEVRAPLPPEANLRRGMVRFFTADYDGARTDFDRVLAATPRNARALYGRLLCAICRSDWKRAAGDLNTLAAAGELRADDRLDAQGVFANAAALPSVIEGLRGYTRYQFSDGAAHLVAAWTLAATGDADGARRSLRLARRWSPDQGALPVLEGNLGVGTAPPTQAPTKAPTAPPVRAPRVPGEGPGVVVADAGTGGGRPLLRVVGR